MQAPAWDAWHRSTSAAWQAEMTSSEQAASPQLEQKAAAVLGSSSPLEEQANTRDRASRQVSCFMEPVAANPMPGAGARADGYQQHTSSLPQKGQNGEPGAGRASAKAARAGPRR